MNKAARGITVEMNGSLADVDEHADDLETMGIYEASLESAIARDAIVPVSQLMRARLANDGLHFIV